MNIEQNIQENETVLIQTKPHWPIFFPCINGFIFAALVELVGPYIGLFNNIFGKTIPLYRWFALAIFFVALVNGLLTAVAVAAANAASDLNDGPRPEPADGGDAVGYKTSVSKSPTPRAIYKT